MTEQNIYNLTKEQSEFKQYVKETAEKYLLPKAAEHDKNGEFPYENIKVLKEHGLMGIPFPTEYGGGGRSYLEYILAMEEISRCCAATGIILSVHTSVSCSTIYNLATAEQKQKYLPPLLKGDSIGAFALTEPNAGSDAANLQTIAKPEGDKYILNGNKVFITSGGVADTYVIFATLDPALKTRGITAFIVEKGYEGFSFGRIEEKMGIRASVTRELIFKDCPVPKENLIGKENEGFKIAMQALDHGRIGIAAQAVGIAQACLELALKYSKERVQFGKPISALQAIQFMLADMATEIDAARLLTYKAAAVKDSGTGRFSLPASQAKLYASETASRCASKCVQILGGYGYTKAYPAERYFRDAKITEIYEGTSEIQRLVIAANLLK